MSLTRSIAATRIFVLACVAAAALGVGGYQAVSEPAAASETTSNQAWFGYCWYCWR